MSSFCLAFFALLLAYHSPLVTAAFLQFEPPDNAASELGHKPYTRPSVTPSPAVQGRPTPTPPLFVQAADRNDAPAAPAPKVRASSSSLEPVFSPRHSPIASPRRGPVVPPRYSPSVSPRMAPIITPPLRPSVSPPHRPTFAPPHPRTFSPPHSRTAFPPHAPVNAPIHEAVIKNDTMGTLESTDIRFGSKATQKHSDLAFIQLRSIGHATIYVNGEQMAKLFNWKAVVVIKLSTAPGDVIGIHAQGLKRLIKNQYGVLMDVRTRRSRTVSGSADFRAVQSFPSLSWTLPTYKDGCKWPSAPVARKTSKHLADFMWARGQAASHDIFIRYVFGGLKCNGKMQQNEPSASPKPEQKTPPDKPDMDKDVSSKRCRCKQIPQKKGRCFYFTGVVGRTESKWRKVCTKRKCFPMYECVGNTAGKTHRCIRKYARYDVKPVRHWYGKRYFCRKVSLTPPRTFLVPYE